MYAVRVALCLLLLAAFSAPTQAGPKRSNRPGPAPKLAESDSLVLGDFFGSALTSRAASALREALRSALDESPFLNLVSEGTAAGALKSLPPGTKFGNGAAAICRALGATAYVSGTLSGGNGSTQMTITLSAKDCRSGELLAHEQADTEVAAVIDALGAAAARLRADLGEARATVSRFNTPLSVATSGSLEALRSWGQGLRALHEKGSVAAIPFLTSAVHLDPEFASAAYDLSAAYRNSGNEAMARATLAQAFSLRDRASVRKRLAIEGLYYSFVTVELDKAMASYTAWIKIYPRDERPVSNLGSLYGDLCRYQEAIAAFKQARRMNPDNYVVHENLMEMLTAIGEFDQARAAYKEMMRRGLDDDSPHVYLYAIAAMQNQVSEMSEQSSWFDGKPGLEHEIVAEEADAVAFRGHLAHSRELSEKAVQLALHAGNREQAASWLLNSAWREVLFGSPRRGLDEAGRALVTAPDSREGAATAAIVLARAGDLPRAEATLRDLERRYSHHSVMQTYWLPTIRAQIALQHDDPVGALRQLRTAAPLDRLFPQVFFYSHMPSVVLRAEAYLKLGKPQLAINEWRTILDNPGIVQLSATAVVARLELARMYALQPAETGAPARANARRAYEEFLSLWHDADDNIPLAVDARREFCVLAASDSARFCQS